MTVSLQYDKLCRVTIVTTVFRQWHDPSTLNISFVYYEWLIFCSYPTRHAFPLETQRHYPSQNIHHLFSITLRYNWIISRPECCRYVHWTLNQHQSINYHYTETSSSEQSNNLACNWENWKLTIYVKKIKLISRNSYSWVLNNVVTYKANKISKELKFLGNIVKSNESLTHTHAYMFKKSTNDSI